MVNAVNGWLVLDKPLNISSAKVGNKLKRFLKVKKIGHVGTLDPLASGVLVFALGQATKLIHYLPSKLPKYCKIYNFEVTWGIATDTADAEGKIISQSSNIPTFSKIEAIIPRFIGEILQKPPAYSAVKINGSRAYALARLGENFTLKARSVTIVNLTIIRHQSNKTTFEITCGGGTYIRSIAQDMGLALDSFGFVSSLRRLKDGLFCISDAFCVEKFFQNDILDVNHVLKLETVLDDIPAVNLTEHEQKSIRLGQSIEHNLENESTDECKNFQDGCVVALFYNKSLVAMGTRTNNIIKPRRVFN